MESKCVEVRLWNSGHAHLKLPRVTLVIGLSNTKRYPQPVVPSHVMV